MARRLPDTAVPRQRPATAGPRLPSLARALVRCVLVASACIFGATGFAAAATSPGCTSVNAGALNVTSANHSYLGPFDFYKDDTLNYTVTGGIHSGDSLRVYGQTFDQIFATSSPFSITMTDTGSSYVNWFTTASSYYYTLSVTCTPAPSAPSVTSVTPSTGPATGGTTVAIAGTDFTGVTGVKIGGTAASYTRNSSVSITATTPAHAAGSVAVTVTNAAGTGTLANAFTYVRADQTVSFTSTAPSSVGGGQTYTPTATASSGLTPTITIDSTSASVCRISGGVISFIGAGTCTVDADQAGDTTWAAATRVQQSITVTVVSQTLSFTSTAPSNATIGQTYTPTATTTASGLTPTITVDAASSSVCSMSGGVVTFNAVGSCILDADQAGNAGVTAATQIRQSITVTKAAQTVSFTSTAPSGATVGQTYTPAATTTASGLTPTIAVDAASSSVCSMSGGVVTFDATGSCVLDADQAGNATYSAATQARQTVTVGKAAPTLALTSSTATPTPGLSVTLTATLTGAVSPSGTVTFLDGASPLGAGTISGTTATFTTTSLALGGHTITAVYGGDAKNAGASSGSVSVTTTKATPGIALSASSASVMQSAPVTLSATVSGGITPTGTVTFRDGATALATVPLSGGTATHTTAALSIGDHSVTAAYSGDAVNASVTSSVLVVSVALRPDPSTDPTVRAMITSQVTTSTRFAQTQIDNTVRRLEAIHDDTDDGDDSTTSERRQASAVSGNDGRSPIGGSASRSAGTNGRTASASDDGRAGTSAGPDYMNRALAFGDETPSGRSSQSDAGRAVQKIARAFVELEKKANLPFHVWTAGSLDFGKLNVDGSYDNRFSTAGLTIGLDKRIADGVTAGLALGYGLDHATFGSDGSKQDATAYTAMLYGSWRVIPKTFLDVTGGYGTLHFDEKRWSAGGNAMLSGTRDGRSAFGSVGLTRTEKWDAWKVSGYGRLDVVHVMLDDYRETGSNLWALAYDELTTTTVSAVAGLKAGYEIRTEWGSLTPGARLEYRHAFEGGFTQNLGYADLGTMPYSITGTRRTRDAITGGLSLRAMTFGDLGLDLEYLLTSDTHTVSNQQVRASVRVAF